MSEADREQLDGGLRDFWASLGPQRAPDVMYVGPKTHRALQWEWEGRDQWADRDWRRVKRERRKFMARARA